MDSTSKPRPGKGGLQRQVPDAPASFRPDLGAAGAGVVAPAQLAGGRAAGSPAPRHGVRPPISSFRSRTAAGESVQPVLVFHSLTKDGLVDLALPLPASSCRRPPLPQKWPLKWVPISWPSSHAWPMLSIVARTASSPRKGIAEASGGHRRRAAPRGGSGARAAEAPGARPDGSCRVPEALPGDLGWFGCGPLCHDPSLSADVAASPAGTSGAGPASPPSGDTRSASQPPRAADARRPDRPRAGDVG